MPLSTVSQLYPCESSHYSCFSWVSPVLGWGSEVSCPRHSHKKTQRIQCSSNPGPLDYESNTSPLSHAGPLPRKEHFWGMIESACLSVFVSFCVQNNSFLSKRWLGYYFTFSDSSSLHCFQRYLSHMATAHIIYAFPRFHQYQTLTWLKQKRKC